MVPLLVGCNLFHVYFCYLFSIVYTDVLCFSCIIYFPSFVPMCCIFFPVLTFNSLISEAVRGLKEPGCVDRCAPPAEKSASVIDLVSPNNSNIGVFALVWFYLWWEKLIWLYLYRRWSVNRCYQHKRYRCGCTIRSTRRWFGGPSQLQASGMPKEFHDKRSLIMLKIIVSESCRSVPERHMCCLKSFNQIRWRRVFSGKFGYSTHSSPQFIILFSLTRVVWHLFSISDLVAS